MKVLPTTPGPLHTPPVGVAVNSTVVSVKHTRIGALVRMIFAPALTVIVKVLEGPEQLKPALVKVGVTVIVATTGEVVGLMAVNDGMFPMPLAPRPIVVLLFVQVKIVLAIVPAKVTAAVFEPLHTVRFAGCVTCGVGLTVIVKLVVAPPAQPAALVDTIIVATTGALPALIAMKLAILPVPLAARPIDGWVLTQLYVEPAGLPEKVTGAVAVPAHTSWLPTPFTIPDGFTVIVNVTGVPGQLRPLAVLTGVTVIVAVTGAVVLLVAMNEPIFPVPPAARPILVLLLVQVNTVPGTGPLSVTAALAAPLHKVWLAIAFTDGVGFTVMVNDTDGPVQVTPPLVKLPVTVIVATTGAVPVLVAVNDGIFPAPNDARPMDGWLLAQV